MSHKHVIREEKSFINREKPAARLRSEGGAGRHISTVSKTPLAAVEAGQPADRWTSFAHHCEAAVQREDALVSPDGYHGNRPAVGQSSASSSSPLPTEDEFSEHFSLPLADKGTGVCFIISPCCEVMLTFNRP